MTFLIPSNSTSMLTASQKEICSDHHSDSGISTGHYSLSLFDKEDSSIGSLPSLYRHKDFEEDTEDINGDNIPHVESTKICPPKTYSPQLNFILNSPSPSVTSSIKSYCSSSSNNSHTYSLSTVYAASTSDAPTVSAAADADAAAAVHTPMDDKPSKSPLPSIPCFSSTLNMDIRSPSQPSHSSSRFLNAFHRIRYGHNRQNANHNNSVAPAEVTIKPSSTKSSLADKIKSKFQKHKATTVVATDKKKTFSTPRSASLSSITAWSRQNLHKSTSATDKAMLHSASTTSLMSEKTGSSSSSVSSASVTVATPPAFSLTKSISSHRLYTHKSSTDTKQHHWRQPLRAVNPNRHESLLNNKSRVRFTTFVSMRETYSKAEYDRGSDPNAVCTRLTPAIAQGIKEELNAYKLHEMQVHEYSRVHTHFFL